MHLPVIPFLYSDGMADVKGERETALKKVKALTVLDNLQNGQEALEQCRKITKYEKTALSV